jgi:hypothetical protein
MKEKLNFLRDMPFDPRGSFIIPARSLPRVKLLETTTELFKAVYFFLLYDRVLYPSKLVSSCDSLRSISNQC